MKSAKTPYQSLIAGIIAVSSLGIGIILQHLFPPAEGHKSAFYSAAGPIIFVLSTVSLIAGPIALFSGIKAIKMISKNEIPKEKKRIAIVGTILGSAISSIYLLAVILVAWFVISVGLKQ